MLRSFSMKELEDGRTLILDKMHDVLKKNSNAAYDMLSLLNKRLVSCDPVLGKIVESKLTDLTNISGNDPYESSSFAVFLTDCKDEVTAENLLKEIKTGNEKKINELLSAMPGDELVRNVKGALGLLKRERSNEIYNDVSKFLNKVNLKLEHKNYTASSFNQRRAERAAFMGSLPRGRWEEFSDAYKACYYAKEILESDFYFTDKIKNKYEGVLDEKNDKIAELCLNIVAQRDPGNYAEMVNNGIFPHNNDIMSAEEVEKNRHNSTIAKSALRAAMFMQEEDEDEIITLIPGFNSDEREALLKGEQDDTFEETYDFSQSDAMISAEKSGLGISKKKVAKALNEWKVPPELAYQFNIADIGNMLFEQKYGASSRFNFIRLADVQEQENPDTELDYVPGDGVRNEFWRAVAANKPLRNFITQDWLKHGVKPEYINAVFEEMDFRGNPQPYGYSYKEGEIIPKVDLDHIQPLHKSGRNVFSNFRIIAAFEKIGDENFGVDPHRMLFHQTDDPSIFLYENPNNDMDMKTQRFIEKDDGRDSRRIYESVELIPDNVVYLSGIKKEDMFVQKRREYDFVRGGKPYADIGR